MNILWWRVLSLVWWDFLLFHWWRSIKLSSVLSWLLMMCYNNDDNVGSIEYIGKQWDWKYATLSCVVELLPLQQWNIWIWIMILVTIQCSGLMNHFPPNPYNRHITCHGPLARYGKWRVRMHRECRERFPRQQRQAIPTCITARVWHTCRDACRDC